MQPVDAFFQHPVLSRGLPGVECFVHAQELEPRIATPPWLGLALAKQVPNRVEELQGLRSMAAACKAGLASG